MLYLFPWPEVLVKDPAQLNSAITDMWIWGFIVTLTCLFFFVIIAQSIAYGSIENKGRDIVARRVVFFLFLVLAVGILLSISNYLIAPQIVAPHLRASFWSNFWLILGVTIGFIYIGLTIAIILTRRKSKVATIWFSKKR